MYAGEEKSEKKCPVDTTIREQCLKNCKSVFAGNQWGTRLREECFAKEKLREFIYGHSTFSIALSAFLQAQPDFIAEFCGEGDVELDLIRYFLSICIPEDVREIVENLSNEILFNIIRVDYANYLKIRSDMGRNKFEKSYFLMKSNRYWSQIPQKKMCSLISYLIRDKKDPKLASQFLVILPSSLISNLNINAGLSEDEERELYLALGDNIYELPLISPASYEHMTELFRDNIEIHFILETMAELVHRKALVLKTTETLVTYYNKTGDKLTIQSIYSELYGLELELIMEILNQLREGNVITPAEKLSLQKIFEEGGIDFIRGIKSDLMK
ncbi:MAG: hypothetical protein K8R21_05430 [Leptospira sp.]|nr:hypothetical protein [Leptospira sp.]